MNKNTFSYLGLGFILILSINSCSGNSPSPSSTAAPLQQTISPSPLPIITSIPTASPTLSAPGLPEGLIPDGLGATIHALSDLNLLEQSGIKVAREDFSWNVIERSPGRYNFSGWDGTVKLYSRRGVRMVFILDYGNPLYDNGQAPHTDVGRAAYASFAAAAAEHYAGKGVIWELWNEPDLSEYWQPVSNVRDYAELAKETITAMRLADPNAIIIGPSTAGFDNIYGSAYQWDFIEQLGEYDVLSQFDAIDVHLYRGTVPESVISDVLRLRRIVDSFSPDKKIPITATEWGYTAGGEYYGLGVTEYEQAQYLVRSWLLNLSHEINLSLWYDWKNDGDNPRDPEHNFGMITSSSKPKLTYQAAQTLTHVLNGYRFIRRIPTDSPDDYLLLFRNDSKGVLAAWTSTDPHTLNLEGIAGHYQVVNLIGEKQTVSSTTGDVLSLSLDGSVQYFLLEDGRLGNEDIFWQPSSTFFHLQPNGKADIPVLIQNPSAQEKHFRLSASVDEQEVGEVQIVLQGNETRDVLLSVIYDASWDIENILTKVNLEIDGVRQGAWLWLQNQNYLDVEILPSRNAGISLQIKNPWRLSRSFSCHIKTNDTEMSANIAIPTGEAIQYETITSAVDFDTASLQLKVTDSTGNIVYEDGKMSWAFLGPFENDTGWSAHMEAGAHGDISTSRMSLPEPLPIPYDNKVLEVDYRITDGYFLVDIPNRAKAIRLRAQTLGFWIYGNQSHDDLGAILVDSTGQVFNLRYGPISWQGWRYIEYPLEKPPRLYWEGANDGKFHYPLRFYSPIIVAYPQHVDINDRKPIYIAGLSVKYLVEP